MTLGNVHDVKAFSPLFRDSLSILGKLKTVEYFIGDAAYDSLEVMGRVIGEPVVKLNRRRGKPRGIRRKAEGFLRTEEGRRVKSLRGAIERANSFLKEGMRVDEFPSYVRGLRRVALFVREKMLTGLGLMLTNLKTWKPLLSYA